MRAALTAAVVARLGGIGWAVFDAPPVRAGLPHIVVGEGATSDTGAAGLDGAEVRFAVAAYDGGERPVRLRALVEAVEAAVRGLAGPLGEGWRVVSVRLVRSRIARGGADRWTATSEFVARTYRDQGRE